MSLSDTLKPKEPEVIEEEHDFLTIEKLMNEISEPVKTYDLPKIDEPLKPEENASDELGLITGASTKPKIPVRAINSTAKVTVRALDSILGIGLDMLAGDGAESADLETSKDDLKELQEAWAEYYGEKNIAMSPGMQLFITNAAIYAFKFKDAYDARRSAAKIKEQEARINQLEAEAKAKEEAQHEIYNEGFTFLTI
jgi:hypothetical protein